LWTSAENDVLWIIDWLKLWKATPTAKQGSWDSRDGWVGLMGNS
jgi:hypothetical protein